MQCPICVGEMTEYEENGAITAYCCQDTVTHVYHSSHMSYIYPNYTYVTSELIMIPNIGDIVIKYENDKANESSIPIKATILRKDVKLTIDIKYLESLDYSDPGKFIKSIFNNLAFL